MMKRDPFFAMTPFDRMFGQLFNREPFFVRFDESDESALALDVSETEKEVIVRASLPGFDKEDVTIDVHESVLTISASHTEESEEQEETFVRRERRTGSLSRRIELPSAVDEGNAWAELVNGELTLRLHKAPLNSPHRIEIS
ncbi:MAG: Hsp20/alpha crystallin family protein [Phycisphaerales bacterium JB043]